MMAEKKFFFSLLFPIAGAERSVGAVGWKEMDKPARARRRTPDVFEAVGGL
jgi:hypothetical protein